MKILRSILLILALSLSLGARSLQAQTTNATKPAPTARQRPLTARERELKSVETNKASEPLTRFKEEWKSLTPEERAARLKAARDRTANVTPENREARVALVRGRIEKRLAELAAKKKSGAITPDEEKQLEKGERTLKRYEAQKMRMNTSPRTPEPARKSDDAQGK